MRTRSATASSSFARSVSSRRRTSGSMSGLSLTFSGLGLASASATGARPPRNPKSPTAARPPAVTAWETKVRREIGVNIVVAPLGGRVEGPHVGLIRADGHVAQFQTQEIGAGHVAFFALQRGALQLLQVGGLRVQEQFVDHGNG